MTRLASGTPYSDDPQTFEAQVAQDDADHAAMFEVVGAATYDGDSDTLSPTVKRGDKVGVYVFGKPFQGVLETTHVDGKVEVYIPALANTVIVGPDELRPVPLPNIDPVETLAMVIAIATTGLTALASENEGQLRDAVERLKVDVDQLHDLVTRW
jgi:hypothetical protein